MRRRVYVALIAALALLTVPAAALDISYVYDAFGRVVQVIYGAPISKTVTYAYDAAGNIVSVTVTP